MTLIQAFIFCILLMVWSLFGMIWTGYLMAFKYYFPRKKTIYGCDKRGDYFDAYMTRYTLLEWKDKFQICIHIFHRSDADDLHDHPWNFITIPLWRGYWEEVPLMQKYGYKTPTKSRELRRLRPFIPYFREATHQHRVILINGKPAVTLVIMGPVIREWGFWIGGKFVQWRKYFIDKRC